MGSDPGCPSYESAVAARPDHLVVMVHGINGSTSDWKYGADHLHDAFPDNLIVHRSECNVNRLSFEGIDVAGERLAEEVVKLIDGHPEVKKISFVAHSAGGLVARYAIGRLYGPPMRKNVENLATFRHAEFPCGPIHGLEAINFITLSTPHLGSRWNNQIPFLLGLPILEKLACNIGHLIFGRTGMHLLLTDKDKGNFPLLQRMVNDFEDLYFMSALRAFRRRVAYSNACYDHMVGWRTSSIRLDSELPQLEKCISERYPHVMHEEYSGEENTERKQCITVEEELVAGLKKVSWERVDVAFHDSWKLLDSHNLIQVNNNFCLEGSDVIQHMIDHFIV